MQRAGDRFGPGRDPAVQRRKIVGDDEPARAALDAITKLIGDRFGEER
jgi:hypothetical protein